jgi:hypothetical protein
MIACPGGTDEADITVPAIDGALAVLTKAEEREGL